MRVVLDTNIIFSGLYSTDGASFQILSKLNRGFEITISVPLFLEYEDVLMRNRRILGLTTNDIGKFLNYIANIAERKKIYFLWRPYLKDPKDDMVLELAVASRAEAIITFNKKDFAQVQKDYGIKIISANAFLNLLENKK